MADELTPAPGTPAAGTAQPSTPVAAAPTLLGADPVKETPVASAMPEGFEGGETAWAALDDAGKTAITTAATEKAATESKARTDALAAAATPEAKKAAYDALTADEKAAAFKALKPEEAKALGIEDPALPTYDVTKFTAPEGVTLDAEALKPALDVLRKNGVGQEAAQELLTIAMEREVAAAKKSVQDYVDLQTKWQAEVKNDPEIGGDKLTASMASAARAIDRLGVPGLKEALNLTGAGNNPAIVKAFVRLGQMVSEDRFMPGKDAAPTPPKSPAETIYGDGPTAA